MNYRNLTIVIIFLSVLMLPYWVYLSMLLLAVIYFPLFWEGILLALLIDVLHGGGLEGFHLMFSPLALGIMIVLIILLPLKTRLRSYA